MPDPAAEPNPDDYLNLYVSLPVVDENGDGGETWTVAQLREAMSAWPDNARVWRGVVLDREKRDVELHPLKSAAVGPEDIIL